MAAGKTTQALVSSVDIASTFVELAGGSFPSDGKSFAAALRDPTLAHREFAFAEDRWHDFEDHSRAVMTQQFKLIRNDYPDLPPTPSADAGRGLSWQAMLKLQAAKNLPTRQQTCFLASRAPWELFDLQRDPGELTNVFDDPAYLTVRTRLQVALERWRTETKDFMPSKRTPDEFDRVTGEPDTSVRIRPRPSKLDMLGTNGSY